MGSATMEDSLLRGPLVLVSLGLFAWSLRCAWRPSSRQTDRWHAFLLSTFLLVPILGEGLVRLGLACDLEGLRSPDLYGDPFGDDDYWKLKRRGMELAGRNLDPRLGWVTKTTERNPLGILRAADYVPQSENVVLCFGDSFMAGLTPLSHKIPDHLERALNGPCVYNYGVGGYGVGQIYLRFQDTYPEFEQPIVVIGILEWDLDRTLLSLRGAPKPSFRVEGRELVMTAPVLATDAKAWNREHPPEIRSYLCALVRRASQRLVDKYMEAPIGYRQAEKCRVNRAVLDRLVHEARQNQLRILFVSFPSRTELDQPGWRSDFLRDTFKELKVPHVDGRPALQQHIRQSGKEKSAYFLTDDNHPNSLGNQVLAKAIAERIHLLWRPEGK
jgi:hypothetical protein